MLKEAKKSAKKTQEGLVLAKEIFRLNETIAENNVNLLNLRMKLTSLQNSIMLFVSKCHEQMPDFDKVINFDTSAYHGFDAKKCPLSLSAIRTIELEHVYNELSNKYNKGRNKNDKMLERLKLAFDENNLERLISIDQFEQSLMQQEKLGLGQACEQLKVIFDQTEQQLAQTRKELSELLNSDINLLRHDIISAQIRGRSLRECLESLPS